MAAPTTPSVAAPPRPGAADQAPALDTVRLAIRAADAYGRPDLVERLRHVEQRLVDPHVRVLIVGEFKQGKSSLVNGLINARVCPVDDDVATSVPTAVGYAEEPTAVAVRAPQQPDGPPVREEVDIDDIAEHVSELGNPGNIQQLWAFEVGVPRDLLRGGLVLVDTPGVGGLGSAHSATTIGALPSADAVVLVSDASQEFTEPELAFLDLARELTPTVLCVLTKTDFYPRWRTIVELNRGHLSQRGIDAPVLPTSAALRRLALDRGDRELNRESGYPALVAALRDGVLTDVARLARRSAAHNITAVTEQLVQPFEAARRLYADPSQSAELLTELEAARDRADALRNQAARWQQTLGDGFSDLAADAEHELRARTRRLAKQADDGIAEVDPGEVWEQIEQWLYRAVTEEIAAHYAMVTSRARELAAEVATHFADQQGAHAAVDLTAPIEILRQIDPATRVEADDTGRGGKALTAMRGSYGGVMMVGMLGGVVGLGMINPMSLGFGAMLGRKALRDERDRALTQRRAQARQACRGYIDEVSFVVGKDARDTLRRLQRTLRDTFTTRAEELQRSTAGAVEAAQQALRSHESEHQAKLRDIDAELARLRDLTARAQRLTATPGGAR